MCQDLALWVRQGFGDGAEFGAQSSSSTSQAFSTAEPQTLQSLVATICIRVDVKVLVGQHMICP